MNILSIGNSFSHNAHRFLPKIVAADKSDEEFMLCNLSIGGCPLEKHWNNWKNEEEAYGYEIYLPGETQMRITDEVALHEAVEDEDWDVITLQQASGFSGIQESYFPYIDELIAYIRMVKPDAKIGFHQTWAYSQSTGHSAFADYSSNQKVMFEAIESVTRHLQINSDIDFIIPSGLAFQYARDTSLGDSLNSEDGYHANDLGCYLAGACFYEAACGKKIQDNRYILEGYPPEYTQLLKICVECAMQQY